MMSVQLLPILEDLITRSALADEFHEPDIQQLLEVIFTQYENISPEDLPKLKQLFLMLSSMSKSSNFGHFLYEKLQENTLPFSEEVLKTAVLSERYYNLHDKALKAYVSCHLMNGGVDQNTITLFHKLIPEGHGTHFFHFYHEIDKTERESYNPQDPGFYHTLFTVLNNDRFTASQKKLSCIIGFLKLKCFLPSIFIKLNGMLTKPDLTPERILVLMHFLYVIPLLYGEPHSETISEILHTLAGCDMKTELVEKYHSLKHTLSSNLTKNIKQFSLSC